MSGVPAAAVRPRNRKQLIVEAASRAFHDRGYHAASMEDIAAAVGITAAALYRHFPHKYALFARCTTVMADRLAESLDALPEDAGLADLLDGAAAVTLAHRDTGGTYRWEARYLEPDDRRRLRATFTRVVDRVTAAVEAEGEGPEPRLRATAALGAVGSATMHRTAIAPRRGRDLLVGCAVGVAAADLTVVGRGPAVELPAAPVARTRRAEILAAAVPLFEEQGFAAVTMGRIAESVGLATSALYRHYPGKVDILAAACLQAAALLGQAAEQAMRDASDPQAALAALARTYAAYSFEQQALTSVAQGEVVGLPPHLQRPVVAAQRDHVALWEEQLLLARPELDRTRARFLVHAGFGVVVEAGRALRWQDTAEHREVVAALQLAALGDLAGARLTTPGRGPRSPS